MANSSGHMRTSLLAQLREATSEAHANLEATVDISQCLADEGNYAELLRKFHGYYSPLEEQMEALEGWEAFGLDMTSRRKSLWLKDDLVALGVDPSSLVHLPECEDLPKMDSLGSAIGCAYVLEGSTLGGRHISAMLGKSQIPQIAQRFFEGYGSATGERWKEFCAALEAFGEEANDAEREAAVDAAKEAFQCLQCWMERETAAL